MLDDAAFRLSHQIIDNGAQSLVLILITAILAVDAQLAVGARALAQDSQHVANLFAAIKLVNDVIQDCLLYTSRCV